jgi:ferredoxin
MTPISKVWIDADACIATEACLSVETNVFSKQANDYVPAVADNAAKYFDSHRREVIQSVLSCPVGAISLQFADGKVITAYDYDAELGVEHWVNY